MHKEYERMQREASVMIRRFGNQAVLVSRNDASIPKSVAETRTPCHAVLSDERSGYVREGQGVVQTTCTAAISMGDGKIVPQTGDMLEIGNAQWQITEMRPVRPGAVCLVYRAVLQR